MGRIARIFARQILDSRGLPTLEVEVMTEHGAVGTASAPSGASTGKYEALELRDNDPGIYLGKGVLKAVNSVNKILNEELKGAYVFDQNLIDAALIQLDGTSNKSNLGANTMLAVSLAVAKAAAQTASQSLYRYIGGVNGNTLPLPLMNIINGGAHASNNLDFQEFMIMPFGDSFSQSLRMGAEVFHHLKTILSDKKLSTNVGDEGGFAPDLKNTEQAFELILKAIEKAGYKPGSDIALAIDAAASQFYNSKKGIYTLNDFAKPINDDELIAYYEKLCKKYPIISIEDPLDEDAWDSWTKMTKKLGQDIQIVGDDLFVTNTSRIAKGIQTGAANAVLIKPNQIGTVTETINAVELSKSNGYSCVISHRSGETLDTSITEFAVGLNIGQIKTGSLSRGERIAKYNQLLRIEENLENGARFWGKDFIYRKG